MAVSVLLSGPVPTRQSEAIREGWQDYCLLTLLKQRASKSDLAASLQAYKTGTPMETLRLRALRVLTGKAQKGD